MTLDTAEPLLSIYRMPGGDRSGLDGRLEEEDARPALGVPRLARIEREAARYRTLLAGVK